MAKKFQFRLDVVRDMRKRARDEAARLVAGKIMEVAAVQRRVDAFSHQLRDAVEIGRMDREGKRLEIAALKMQQYYGKWLHDRITECSATLLQTEAQLLEERRKLTQATAKLKAIEKLRERRWQRHLLMVRREEQAITDEVAGRMSHAARHVEEGASG
jgi:flagellar export protein FliJ